MLVDVLVEVIGQFDIRGEPIAFRVVQAIMLLLILWILSIRGMPAFEVVKRSNRYVFGAPLPFSPSTDHLGPASLIAQAKGARARTLVSIPMLHTSVCYEQKN
jgi:membrane-bound metal-dependent hydrolase YbcI (DUF457 family)